jgi:HK97 family phage prohead protease
MPDPTYVSGDYKVADFKMFTGMLKAVGDDGDGKLRIRGIASSTVRDRHGDRMERTALKDMERAANDNLTIFVNHSYNVPEDVIGSAESAVLKRRAETDEDGNPLYDLELQVVLDEGNPRALKTFEAVQRGVKLGMSIGAMIPKGGAKYDEENNSFIIHHVDLLETSVVSIPANPRSWVGGAVKALRANPEKLENPGDYRKALAEISGADPDFVTESAESDEIAESAEPVEETVEVTETITIEVEAEAEVEVTESADDPSSQEAHEADPEVEESAEPEAVEESTDLDPQTESDLIALAAEGVLGASQELISQLKAAVVQLEAEKQLRLAAEAERDEAVKAAVEVLTEVTPIIELIAKTPAGRKTGRNVAKAAEDFDHLKGIFSERYLSILSENRS